MGNFTFNKTEIEGVYIIDIKRYVDSRGYFMESFNQADWEKAGLNYTFVQNNQAGSSKGVLRGLHFQKSHPQAKLVRVLSGEVFDVAVDLRKGSKTYGKWFGIVLSGENAKELLIPRGFAHGYEVLSDKAEFSYMCDEFYHPEDEGGIAWNDPSLAIEWPAVENRIMNERDKSFLTLKESGMEFVL